MAEKIGSFSVVAIRGLDAASFDQLAVRVRWGSRERKFFHHLTGLNLDPSRARNIGRRVVEVLRTVDAQHAVKLSSILAGPLLKTQDEYGLGLDSRVTLLRLQTAVPEMVDDVGLDAVRIWLAFHADTRNDSSRLGEEAEYDGRVGYRCAVMLMSESFALPGWMDWDVPPLDPGLEALDAGPDWTPPQVGHALPLSRREIERREAAEAQQVPAEKASDEEHDDSEAAVSSDAAKKGFGSSNIEDLRQAVAAIDDMRADLVAALDASRRAIESGVVPGSEAETIRVRLSRDMPRLRGDLLTALEAEGIAPQDAAGNFDLHAAIDALAAVVEVREAERAGLRSLLDEQVHRLESVTAGLPPMQGFSGRTAAWLGESLRLLTTDEPWTDEQRSLLRSVERVAEAHAAAHSQNFSSILRIGRDRTLSEQALDAVQEAADIERWGPIPKASESALEKDVAEPGVVGPQTAEQASGSDPEPGRESVTEQGVEAEPERSREAEPQPSPGLAVRGTDPRGELPRERDVARCLDSGAFGLAYWIARASGWSEERVGVLAAVTYAVAMQSSTGVAASGYERSVSDFSLDGLTENRGLQVLAFAAAFRTVFVAPYRGASHVLGELESRIDDSGVRDLIATLIRYEGVIPRPSEDGSDGDALERRITAATRSVADGLQALRSRTSKFQRSSDVWREWLKNEGPLGEAMGIVASDGRASLSLVEKRIKEFGPDSIRSLIDETDRALGNFNRNRDRIEGPPVQWVFRNVEEVVGLLRVWAESARTHADTIGSGEGPDSRAQSLRQKLRETQESVLAWLERESDAAHSEGASLRQDAIAAAQRLVDETYSLTLEGRSRVDGDEWSIDPLEGAVAFALDVPFSEFRQRAAGREVDRWLDARALLAGADVSVEEAFRVRCQTDEHLAATVLLERIRSAGAGSDRAEPLLERFAEDLQNRTAETERLLRRLMIDCRDRLDRARQEQHFSTQGTDEQDFEDDLLRLQAEISDLHEAGDYLIARMEIADFESRLDRVLKDAKERILDELEEGIARNPALDSVSERVRRTIDRGQLDTARELMILVDEGRALPEDEGDSLERLKLLVTRVLPALMNRTPRAGALLQAVKERSGPTDDVPIDFTGLSDEAIDRASRGLRAWFRLLEGAAAKTIDAQAEALEHIHALLQLVGLTGPFRVERSQKGDDRSAMWFSVTNARVAGSVRAHQYGSSAEGRYGVLLLAKVPTAAEIVRRLQDRSSEAPIIVICLGLLSLKERQELARNARQMQGRPGIVVDAAVTAMLAAGTGGLRDALELTLPFSWLDPYDPYANAHVPEEVFVGRVEELREIESPTGTHFIYGGRQLGKSALLQASQRSFESMSEHRRAVYIDVKSRLSGFDEPVLLLRIVAERLREVGIPVPDGRNIDPAAALREGVLGWLAEHEERRLLLLLDEVDGFLRSDAPQFRIIDFFKSLFQDSRRRAKPVFAGLQGVQRFMAIENNPFPHLGRHIAIGPLDPGPAKELVTQPLAALGLHFEDPNLIARFLGRTNYLPALIQIYCRTLVRHMAKRAIGPGEPPQKIAGDDLDRVFNDPELLEFVRERFHLTIDLDSRYRIITYAMALNVLETGRSGGMSVDELLDSCNAWWPEGFSRGDWSEFDQLLGEMVGLGVLTREREGKRFRLRSPNVVNLLGDGDRISQVLLEAGEKRLALEQVGPDLGAFRRIFEDRAILPLSEQAMRDVIGRDQVRARLRVLLGSRATSADVMRDAIRQSIKFNDLGNFRTVAGTSELRRNIKPGTRTHFFINLSTAASERVETVLTELREVVEATTDAEVIALVGPEALGIWDVIHGHAASEGGPAVTLLTRLSGASIQAWGRVIDRPLDDRKSIAAVEAATGGWPVIVDELHRLSRSGIPWERALEETRGIWADPQRSAEFIERVGLRRDSAHGFVFDQIAQLGHKGDPLKFRELVDYFATEEVPGDIAVAAVLRDLIAIQVLVEGERAGAEARGVLTPEECFATAWSHHR